MDSLLGALASLSLDPRAPSPAQPSPASPAQDRPVSVLPQADAAFRTAVDGDRRRVEFALTEGSGGGQDAGPVLQRTRPPSLGSHAPCSSLPLGVSRSLAIMTPASRPSVCWKGESRDGAVTALHLCMGSSSRAMSTHRALLSRGTVVGLDGAHGTHWEWSGPTPGSLAGRRAK